VTAVTRTADLQARYDESASAWGLRLAVGVAGLAVLIAGLVLVLVAATAWRGRARDYAALRVAGIPQEVIRRASLAEQAVVVLLATAVGAGCGIASAAMALPILPLFTTPWTALRPDLTLDGAAVVGTVAIALGVLLVSAAGVAAVLVRRATPDRLQEVQ
jgi:ABC-type antimicrobial peptide transport system permease subunit